MAAELIFAPEALSDVAEAYAWYEKRRYGLGEEFLSCVEARTEMIRRRPDMHPVVHDSYRRAILRRFPYAVFYECGKGTVTIYGIFHTARDPKEWRERLP